MPKCLPVSRMAFKYPLLFTDISSLKDTCIFAQANIYHFGGGRFSWIVFVYVGGLKGVLVNITTFECPLPICSPKEILSLCGSEKLSFWRRYLSTRGFTFIKEDS